MNTNQFRRQDLPLAAFREIPTPRPDAKTITALVKQSGRVTGYQLSDGMVVSKEQAVALARQGGIQGVGIASRMGNEYLKTLPDQSDANNLSNLPSISQ